MSKVTRAVGRLVQPALRRFGHELRPVPPLGAAELAPELWTWLRQTQRIRTVIDIGANNGDFAAFLAKNLGARTTYAFEPLASARAELQAKSASIPDLHVFDVALSDQEGTVPFYENSYGPSSSLLRVSETSRVEFPQTADEVPTVVRVARLDDVLNRGALEMNILIKIDVQGLEDRVIRGGQKVFSMASCVLVEMSFVPMYEGQPLFEEVHVLLVDLGFRFAGMKNQISSRRSGQPLFAHCLYLRDESARPAGASVA
jgi:FkbM family methyltransferase